MNALWSMDQECCKGYMTYIQAKRSAYTYSIMSKRDNRFCLYYYFKQRKYRLVFLSGGAGIRKREIFCFPLSLTLPFMSNEIQYYKPFFFFSSPLSITLQILFWKMCLIQDLEHLHVDRVRTLNVPEPLLIQVVICTTVAGSWLSLNTSLQRVCVLGLLLGACGGKKLNKSADSCDAVISVPQLLLPDRDY